MRRHASGAYAGTGATPQPPQTSEELLRDILERLDDDQADDVVVIDLTGKSSMCDSMVIASGRSQRHVTAMAEHLRDMLKPAGRPAPAVEGLPGADWVLIDAGDVIVHLFRPEVRSFYNLEKMWGIELPGQTQRAPPSDGGEGL